MVHRKIARTRTTTRSPGILGEKHIAARVVPWDEFTSNDPFLLLMDDEFELGEEGRIGGAHPHGGLETVTLVLEGALCEIAEDVVLNAGEVQWMTAGRGIIHGENTAIKDSTRLLQLWLTLPKSSRWAAPGCQNIHLDSVSILKEGGVEVRVYSGSSGNHHARTHNHVPVTILEMRLEAGASFEQELPASYNGFLYVIEGAIQACADETPLVTGQVGWFDRPDTQDTSSVRIMGGPEGARVVLYAGEPQGDPIILSETALKGFSAIADTKEDLARMLENYKAGRFELMSDVARAERAG